MRGFYYSANNCGIGLVFTPINLANAELLITEPSKACVLLDEDALITNGWKNEYDQEFSCSSNYKQLGSGSPLANNLAFYVEGNNNSVAQAYLMLNVNDKTSASSAHQELLKTAKILIHKQTGMQLSQKLIDAITNKVRFCEQREPKSNLIRYKSIASFSKGVRTCPYCAEQVKAEALICRFCQRDLPALTEDEIVSLQKPNNYGNKWLWIGILFISAIIIKDIIDRPKDEINQKLDELKQKQKQIIYKREKQCISNAEISWHGYSYGINRLEFSNPYQDEKASAPRFFAKAEMGSVRFQQRKMTWRLLPSAAPIRPASVPLRHIIVYSMRLRSTPTNGFTPCRDALYFASACAIRADSGKTPGATAIGD